MSERYTKKDVRNVWENRFLPAAVSMGFDIEEWSLTVGNSSYSRPFVIDCPIPVPAYSSVMTAGGHAGMASIGMTAREAYMTLVNMACAWEAVARVQQEARRANLRADEGVKMPPIPSGHDSQCGECGRTWNSTETPTPSARCPFEYEHEGTLTGTITVDGLGG